MHCQHTTNEPREVKPKKNKEARKRRTQAGDKKLRKVRTITYSSKDWSPKTRATARRNRSKAKTWLLKDRGNARRSHARSRGKTRKTRSQKQSRNSTSKAFPSHKYNSPKMMHSQGPVPNKFFKNQTSLPLVRLLLPKFSPLLAHVHIKSKKT